MWRNSVMWRNNVYSLCCFVVFYAILSQKLCPWRKMTNMRYTSNYLFHYDVPTAQIQIQTNAYKHKQIQIETAQIESWLAADQKRGALPAVWCQLRTYKLPTMVPSEARFSYKLPTIEGHIFSFTVLIFFNNQTQAALWPRPRKRKASRTECDEYIRICEYIGHEYIFGHSFVSIFLLRIYSDIRSYHF